MRTSVRRSLALLALTAASLLAASAPALAATPEPPEISTASVFATTATLNGVLNPRAPEAPAEVATYQFVYRVSTENKCKGAGAKFAPASPALPANGGQPGEPVSEPITGLAPETEYAACLVAENAEGEAISTPVSFTTTAPAAVETPEASAAPPVLAKEATLHGVLNPAAPEAVEPGTYQFVYRQNATQCEGAGQKLAPVSPAAAAGGAHEEVTAPITGLTPNTDYSVCVIAKNDDGQTATSVSAPFKTAIPPQTPVTEPATGETATTAVVHGELNPSAAGTAGWHFEYSNPGGAACNEGPTTESEAEVTGTAVKEHAELTGLQPHQTYKVCVVATNSAGEAATGNEVSLETLGQPPVVDSESVSALAPQSATLEAQINPNNETTDYTFEYSTKATGEVLEGTITKVNGLAPVSGFPDQTASIETGSVLSQDVMYFYRVVATNAKSEEAKGKVQHFNTPPEAPVTTSPAKSITGTSATFEGVLYPNNAGQPGIYEFLYNEGAGCEGGHHTGQFSTTGTKAEAVSAPIAGLNPNREYTFCLFVTDGFGEHAVGAGVTFTTLPSPIVGSSSATEAAGGTALDVSGTVNPDGEATTCVVQYGTSLTYGNEVPCEPANLGAGTAPVAVTALLSHLKANAEYHFRIVATNHSGTVDGSDNVRAGFSELVPTPPEEPPVPGTVLPAASPFTTTPQPAVIPHLTIPQLETKEPKTGTSSTTLPSTKKKCAKGKHLSKGKCVKTKPKKKKKKK